MEGIKEAWYCVACRPRAEEAVSLQLCRTVGVEVYVPQISSGRGRKRATGRVVLFPGYVFVRMCLASSLSSIRYTPGVRDIVRFGNQIPAVPEDIIQGLRIAVEIQIIEAAESTVEEGMRVRVAEGAFKGFAGKVVRISSAKDRVQLLIELLGQSLLLELDSDAVQAA